MATEVKNMKKLFLLLAVAVVLFSPKGDLESAAHKIEDGIRSDPVCAVIFSAGSDPVGV